ncbi:MAG: hypothetical protein CM15mP103_03870 [Gammaproteobacteria bacterium]|nr:MAG: hypothetical protein CM15mP103_03870 [Gammaproteobacteria bacterium]
MPEFAFQFNYGYHFDAAKLSVLLRDHAVDALGVTHMLANLTEVEFSSSGEITALTLDNGTSLSGMCSSTARAEGTFIGEAMGVPRSLWVTCYPMIVRLPPRCPIATLTPQIALLASTAQASGWIWDIGLQSRRGGRVRPKRCHFSEDEAVSSVLDYVKHWDEGVDWGQLNVRVIPFDASRRRQAWVKNCVAVGLSGLYRTAGGVLDCLD